MLLLLVDEGTRKYNTMMPAAFWFDPRTGESAGTAYQYWGMPRF